MIRIGDIEIDRANVIIRHRGVDVPLRNGGSYYRRKELLFHMILGGPQSLVALFEVVYGDDPEGGPEAGLAVNRIMFKQLEPMLAVAGLQIAGEGRYRRSQLYRIEPIP